MNTDGFIRKMVKHQLIMQTFAIQFKQKWQTSSLSSSNNVILGILKY